MATKRKILIIFLIPIFVLIITIGIIVFLYLRWSFKVNEYCNNKAAAIVGDKAADTVPANDQEKQQFPELTDISLVFREQIKCEHDPDVLSKFKGLF